MKGRAFWVAVIVIAAILIAILYLFGPSGHITLTEKDCIDAANAAVNGGRNSYQAEYDACMNLKETLERGE